MEIILALAETERWAAQGATVNEVAEWVGVDKSQASRTLQRLFEDGWLDRDSETRRYALSLRFLHLGARAGDPRAIEVARPILADLAHATGETTYLSVLAGGAVLTIVASLGSPTLRSPAALGSLTPISCTSTGRALLLAESDDQIAALLDGQSLPGTDRAPKTIDELMAVLTRERISGVTISDEEYEAGLIGIAAPAEARGARYAVNVSGPAFRVRPRQQAFAANVLQAARTLSESLGERSEAPRVRGG